MVHILLNVDTLARCQAYLCPGRHRIRPAVAVDSHVGDLVDGLVGQAVVDAYEHVAFAAIFGKVNWKWFAALAVGLAILAAANAVVQYAAGSKAGTGVTDTFGV